MNPAMIGGEPTYRVTGVTGGSSQRDANPPFASSTLPLAEKDPLDLQRRALAKDLYIPVASESLMRLLIELAVGLKVSSLLAKVVVVRQHLYAGRVLEGSLVSTCKTLARWRKGSRVQRTPSGTRLQNSGSSSSENQTQTLAMPTSGRSSLTSGAGDTPQLW